MNAEQVKRLEEIKKTVYGRDCEKAYDRIHDDRNWLIARLEAEERECAIYIPALNLLSTECNGIAKKALLKAAALCVESQEKEDT